MKQFGMTIMFNLVMLMENYMWRKRKQTIKKHMKSGCERNDNNVQFSDVMKTHMWKKENK